MSEKMCHISVIIPTHNRSASLRVTLDALNKQTYPFEQFEVVVVADGCNDNTIDMLKTYSASFSFKVIEQPGKGAAAARNPPLRPNLQAAPRIFWHPWRTHLQPVFGRVRAIPIGTVPEQPLGKSSRVD